MNLEVIQANLFIRLQNRDQIVGRRVKELLDPNGKATAWFPPIQEPNSKPLAQSAVDFSKSESETPTLSIDVGTQGDPNLSLAQRTPIATNATRDELSTDVLSRLRQSRDAYTLDADQLRGIQTTLERESQLLSQLSDKDKVNEEDIKIRIENAKIGIEYFEGKLQTRLVEWNQIWAGYQSQHRLLALNVDEARVKFDNAQKELAIAKEIVKRGAGTDSESRRFQGESELAGIGLKRAEEILKSHEAIEKLEPNLNPTSVSPAKPK